MISISRLTPHGLSPSRDSATFFLLARTRTTGGAWAEQVKKQRVAADLLKLRQTTILDPIRRMDVERKIEDQKIYLGEVIDLHQTPEGLKKLITDSIVRGGKSKDDAEAIRKRIGTGRQMQLASIICSEPVPTIDEYRDAIRKLCRERAMTEQQIASLSDADMIRIASEIKPAGKPPETESELFQEGADLPTDTQK